MATALRRGGRADHRAVDAPGRREHRYVPPRSPRTRTLTTRRARTHIDGAQKWLATLGTGFLSALAHWIVGLFFTLPTLAALFAELAPPPRLHCVRCHKDYVEVENDDRSCLVAHDDESAEVERVGTAKRAGRVPGTVRATFETLWGCCGKIVEGDGDQGPPDGWCYEGMHTVRHPSLLAIARVDKRLEHFTHLPMGL